MRPPTPRERVAAARRVVLKVGTNVIMRDDGAVALGRLYSLIESVASARSSGREVILVSSGAVGLGAQRLRLDRKPGALHLKQACAAIGQSRLMSVYEEGFEKLGLLTAQVLLTEDDFMHRTRYLNLKSTLETLISLGAVPIINENDTVSTAELETPSGTPGRSPVFGDNDRLSALVMSKIEADLLVILSDVSGLHDRNPTTHDDARLLPLVPRITPEIEAMAEGGGARGRGGMRTKLSAAKIATSAGGLAVIANGRTPGVLDRVLAGEEVGTLFLPTMNLQGKRRWIAYAAVPAGALVVNDGAREALVTGKASLLPKGVVRLSGTFEKGDVVTILSPDGTELGRGQVNYGSEEAGRLVGLHSDEIARLVSRKGYDALVTRNNLVLFSAASARPGVSGGSLDERERPA